MARRTSRRRRTRRNSRRRASRRNPKYVVANRRRRRTRRNSRRRGSRRSSRMRHNRRRRVRRNPDYMREVITPVAGGAAGFVAARALGNFWAQKGWISTDPKMAKLAAAGIAIPATFLLAQRMPGNIVAQNKGAIVLGMGLAAAEAFLRDTPLLGGSPAAAQVTEDTSSAPASLPGTAPLVDQPGEQTVVEGGDGLSSYFGTAGLGGDYYTAAMLGQTDPADQSAVEASLDSMERNGGDIAVSTVIPTDLAMKASTMPQWAPIRERFANRGDRGHAGGMFARTLFSGMMGS